MIVAEPVPTAVTLPSATVATASLEEDHVTFLFVALVGAIVAVNVLVLVPFKSKFKVEGVNVTPVTATVLEELPEE